MNLSRHRSATTDSLAVRPRSPLAALVFFAFTTPFGIAAHLISELAGLGWHDDADVAFSARHGYLAPLACTALAALFFALRSMPRGDRRARVAALVDALPFHGRGFGFTLTSFVAQFGFFALSQIGEGCPLCSGDVVTGIFAAAVAAALGGLAVTLCKRRVLAFALALVWYVSSARRVMPGVRASRRRVLAPIAARRLPFSFRYRPPPTLLALDPH